VGRFVGLIFLTLVDSLFSHLRGQESGCRDDLFSHLEIRSEVVDSLASFHTCVDRSEAAFLCIGSIKVSTVGRHVRISDACRGQASRG
jgi:hypothetical protein